MAISTDVPIYTTTLASDAADVTVPLTSYQMYANLKVVVEGSHDQAGSSVNNWRVRFNNDSTSGVYSDTVWYGSGATASSARDASNNLMYLGIIGQASTSPKPLSTFILMDYSSSTKYKTILCKGYGPSDNINAAVGLWRNSTPVTSIVLFMTGQNIKAGTTISVYGIGTASTAKATGGAIYSDSNYWYHVFANTSTFTPTQALTADILVVAGGGGGGSYNGGGGAGGFQAFTSQSLTTTSYTCTVGAGGSAGWASAIATNGGNSQFGALTASVGGGFGSSGEQVVGSGGSGGGGAGRMTGPDGTTAAGGSGTSGQGYAGGTGKRWSGNVNEAGGGGGGAGAVGGNGTITNSGNGGIGVTSTLINSIGNATGVGELVSGNWYFAGGGGGTNWAGTNIAGLGGYGGGTAGVLSGSRPANGKAFTGGGGGAGGRGVTNEYAANGGSGVVIVRYAK